MAINNPNDATHSERVAFAPDVTRPPWDEQPRHGRATRRPGARLTPRLLLVVAILVAPLVAVEGFVRILIATERLPPARAYLRDFEITWENLQRRGSVDVLVLGDSVSQQGIDPAVLAQLIEGEVHASVDVFNAASASGTLGINRAVVQQLEREGRLPRVAIIGLQTGSLRDDNTYRRVFLQTPMGQLFSGCDGTSSLETGLSCLLAEASAAWRWRGHPADVLTALRRPVPRTSRSQGLYLRADGFRAGSGIPLSGIQAQVATALPEQPADVKLGADAEASYVSMVAELEAAGVTVVAVMVPEAPMLERALLARNRTWEAEREGAIAELERETGLPIVDPHAFGAWYADGAARNFKHLSASGAASFVRQLWSIPAFRTRVLRGLGT
jgi:hypothetical protein